MESLGKSRGQNPRGPSVFGLGTSLGTPLTMIPPRLFHTLSHTGTIRDTQCPIIEPKITPCWSLWDSAVCGKFKASTSQNSTKLILTSQYSSKVTITSQCSTKVTLTSEHYTHRRQNISPPSQSQTTWEYDASCPYVNNLTSNKESALYKMYLQY